MHSTNKCFKHINLLQKTLLWKLLHAIISENPNMLPYSNIQIAYPSCWACLSHTGSKYHWLGLAAYSAIHKKKCCLMNNVLCTPGNTLEIGWWEISKVTACIFSLLRHRYQSVNGLNCFWKDYLVLEVSLFTSVFPDPHWANILMFSTITHILKSFLIPSDKRTWTVISRTSFYLIQKLL